MRTHDAINGTNIFETAYNECREVHNMGGVTMENIFAIERDKGRVEGIAAGRAEGMAKGEKAAKVKIAANLLSLGVPMKTIMQASGLSEEEIKNYCCPVKLLQAVFYI